MYVFIILFSRLARKKDAPKKRGPLATGRTFQYNSGCWGVAFVAGIIRKMLFGLVLEDAIVGEEHSYRFYEAAPKKVEREDALQLQRSGVPEERSWPEVNSRSTYRDILTLALAKEKQAAAVLSNDRRAYLLAGCGGSFPLSAAVLFSCAEEYPPIYDQGIKYGR
jgi:hypothetical protein